MLSASKMIMKEYLTKEEINGIEIAAKHPAYRISNVMVLGSNSIFDIVKVSELKGLVLIKGNKYFGLKHLNERHSHYSKKDFWVKDPKNRINAVGKEIKKLDNPSRFSKFSIPFLEFVRIAEDLYDSKFLNKEKNTKQEILELYIGESDRNIEGVLRRYKLLLYKETKIIHTLFPLNEKSKKKRPKKSQFNFHREKWKCTTTFTAEDVIKVIEVPYMGFDKKTRFILIIWKSLKMEMEKHYVQVNDPDGMPCFTHLLKENEFDKAIFWGSEELEELDRIELTSFEKLIGNLDKQYWPHEKITSR